MSSVSNVYDNLFYLNSKRKDKGTYPIHKNLRYEDKEIDSLYDYLWKEYDLPRHGTYLDCGCGVGFGSLFLAERMNAIEVKGISLSEKEIDLANQESKRLGLDDRCTFIVQSFDDLPENTFDCIVAIESLKHSPMISNTMAAISRALKPGGSLYIIEDVAKNKVNNFASKRQSQDWALPKINTLEDYQNVECLEAHEYRNLTDNMPAKNIFTIMLRVFVCELMVLLSKLGFRSLKGADITRGGIYQEWLYATGKLDYLVMTSRKKEK